MNDQNNLNLKHNENESTPTVESSNPVNQPDPSEKKNSKIGIWIIAALCVLALTISVSLYLASPKKVGSNDIEQRTVTLTDVGFDTPVTFRTTCSEDDFNKYLSIVSDTFKECGIVFDAVNTYEDAQSLKSVNEDAHKGPISVDERIIEVYNDALKIHKVNPSFDPSQGKLTALWRDAMNAEEAILPEDEAIQAAINPDSVDAVKVDGDTIELLDEQAALDFGAIAKGYTAQLAADRLQEAGLSYGFINAGGNVVLIGEKPDGSDWRVGIQDPDENRSLVTWIGKEPLCLVTSGDYQRYMEVDGKRYSHIIDPLTGYPDEYMRSVTVIHSDSTYCDGMSTALFCMSVEDGKKLCSEIDLDAVWICDKGQCSLDPDLSTDTFDIYITDGLKDHIQLNDR